MYGKTRRRLVLAVFQKEYQRIGLNILYRRRELKMSQETLANLSGVSRSRISDIERGCETFKLSSLMLIAKALEIDYRELLK
ncbi:MAG TPA: XRE family transcriptional regulator [Acidaminococcaceae bacterium]|nr:XRE family transcriptional regulator [Acidaminococcaceae bacterium]